MAIKLWMTHSFSSLVYSMDDAARSTDYPSATVPVRFVTGKFCANGNAYAHIRSFLQQVFVEDSVIASATPVVNGTENPLNAIAFTADASIDGNSVQMQIPMYAGGVDFQIAVDVSQHPGKVEFGGAEMWLSPRRQKPL